MKNNNAELREKRNRDIVADYKKMKESGENLQRRFIMDKLKEKYYLEVDSLYRIIDANITNRAF